MSKRTFISNKSAFKWVPQTNSNIQRVPSLFNNVRPLGQEPQQIRGKSRRSRGISVAKNINFKTVYNGNHRGFTTRSRFAYDEDSDEATDDYSGRQRENIKRKYEGDNEAQRQRICARIQEMVGTNNSEGCFSYPVRKMSRQSYYYPRITNSTSHLHQMVHGDDGNTSDDRGHVRRNLEGRLAYLDVRARHIAKSIVSAQDETNSGWSDEIRYLEQERDNIDRQRQEIFELLAMVDTSDREHANKEEHRLARANHTANETLAKKRFETGHVHDPIQIKQGYDKRRRVVDAEQKAEHLALLLKNKEQNISAEKVSSSDDSSLQRSEIAPNVVLNQDTQNSRKSQSQGNRKRGGSPNRTPHPSDDEKDCENDRDEFNTKNDNPIVPKGIGTPDDYQGSIDFPFNHSLVSSRMVSHLAPIRLADREPQGYGHTCMRILSASVQRAQTDLYSEEGLSLRDTMVMNSLSNRTAHFDLQTELGEPAVRDENIFGDDDFLALHAAQPCLQKTKRALDIYSQENDGGCSEGYRSAWRGPDWERSITPPLERLFNQTVHVQECRLESEERPRRDSQASISQINYSAYPDNALNFENLQTPNRDKNSHGPRFDNQEWMGESHGAPADSNEVFQKNILTRGKYKQSTEAGYASGSGYASGTPSSKGDISSSKSQNFNFDGSFNSTFSTGGIHEDSNSFGGKVHSDNHVTEHFDEPFDWFKKYSMDGVNNPFNS